MHASRAYFTADASASLDARRRWPWEAHSISQKPSDGVDGTPHTHQPEGFSWTRDGCEAGALSFDYLRLSCLFFLSRKGVHADFS